MQEYKRQIAYLYAYEYGIKMRSAGFVKAEERAGLLRVAVHLKSYCHPGEAAGKAYIYFYRRKRPIGICLGDLENRNGALEWQGIMDAQNILDKGVRFSETKGVWIRRPDNRHYVADWDDYPVDISRFLLYPKGGQKCIQCPRFGSCGRNDIDTADRRGKVYEGGHPAGA